MIETPEQRSERGAAMVLQISGGVTDITGNPTVFANADWVYHAKVRDRLSSSERAEFDLAFVQARDVAGVRPSVDLALAAMRAKLSLRLGTPTWRAG